MKVFLKALGALCAFFGTVMVGVALSAYIFGENETPGWFMAITFVVATIVLILLVLKWREKKPNNKAEKLIESPNTTNSYKTTISDSGVHTLHVNENKRYRIPKGKQTAQYVIDLSKRLSLADKQLIDSIGNETSPSDFAQLYFNVWDVYSEVVYFNKHKPRSLDLQFANLAKDGESTAFELLSIASSTYIAKRFELIKGKFPKSRYEDIFESFLYEIEHTQELNPIMPKELLSNWHMRIDAIREGRDSMPTYYDPMYVVDHMDGHDFEVWCAELLKKSGFTNVDMTGKSGDQGVDIVAQKDGIRYAIQCKCYSSNLGNTPVQEVNAGKAMYNCQVGAVMTNRYFTDGAKALAERNGILLWDRDKIEQMIKLTAV